MQDISEEEKRLRRKKLLKMIEGIESKNYDPATKALKQMTENYLYLRI